MAKKKKTTAKLLNELQLVFNHWVRLRDAEKECISCGKPMPPEETANASHLFCVKGWGFLRFHPDNVHKSCVKCNLIMEGNTVNYLKRLPGRIGQKATDDLVALANNPQLRNNHKWQRWELEEMIKEYRQKVKTLSGQ